MIRPPNAFGNREWKKYIGVDAGKEPLLPLWAYALDEKKYMLTFIPDKVKVAKDGKEEEAVLDNLETIGNLVKKPITDLETGFVTDFKDYPKKYRNWIINAIQEKRHTEKPHWVCIMKEPINYIYYIKEEDAEKFGGSISELIDTVISLFMEYARSKEHRIIQLPSKDKITALKIKGTEIRIYFLPSGLVIGHDYYLFDNPDFSMAYALSWRS